MEQQHQPGTALLVMDMQAGILSRLPDKTALVQKTIQALAYARKRGLPVIFVRLGFRPGFPEISENNKTFAAIKTMGGVGIDMEAFMQIDDSLQPMPGEMLVTKLRVSAFAGSDLSVLLRSLNIRHLVLSGIATSGVVLSTLREAADMDYEITVLADACADMDEEVHHVLLTKVFPRQANVVNVDQWQL